MSLDYRAWGVIDPWGEWVNPEVLPEVARLLLAGVGGYHASVSYIRGGRPTEERREAQTFWENPLSKAHLLNAVLRRGNRSILMVEAELGLPPGKFYLYRDNWHLIFRLRPQKQVTVMDLEGDTYDADVVSDEPQPGLVRLKLWGYPRVVVGRWSPNNQAYRLLTPLEYPIGILPVPAAAAAVGVHPSTLNGVLLAGGVRSNGKAYLCDLRRFFPDVGAWLDAAMGYAIEFVADDDDGYVAFRDAQYAAPPLARWLSELQLLSNIGLLLELRAYQGVSALSMLYGAAHVGIEAPEGGLTARGRAALNALQGVADALDVNLVDARRHLALGPALFGLQLPARLDCLYALRAGRRAYLWPPPFGHAAEATDAHALERAAERVALHPAVWDREGLADAEGITSKGRAVLAAFEALAAALGVRP